MKHTEIIDVLATEPMLQTITVSGWVKAFRSNRFIALNDGSTIKNIQCVVDYEKFEETLLKQVTIGAAISVTGTLLESQGKGQTIEIKVNELVILGLADPEEIKRTILSPKRHALETLREQAHLRVRTNTFGAVMRLRSKLAFAVHEFFQTKGFHYMNAPIITGSDAEGAGEMFKVTTFDLENVPKTEDGAIDYSKDFFGKETNLTVSGQLEAETYAMGLGKVYTFGPTFRAENSNTSRHLAEFWMIEPEMAFYDLDDNMDLAEAFIQYVIRYALDNCQDDLAFLEQRLLNEEKSKPQNERSEMALLEKLSFVVENQFIRVTYTEAIDILKNSKPNKKKKFKFPIDQWGADLQSEHERYLVEKHFKKPVILFDYPASIKASCWGGWLLEVWKLSGYLPFGCMCKPPCSRSGLSSLPMIGATSNPGVSSRSISAPCLCLPLSWSWRTALAIPGLVSVEPSHGPLIYCSLLQSVAARGLAP